ncbi:MAG: GH3 auxin-responsive promoter family protein, partial [Deltaproteobacteria bacterium]|nr:GH3 auxin-responsive promoter family protein [Deltaproteobacteria bacterium]
MSLINLLIKARIYGEGMLSEKKLFRNSLDPKGSQLKVLKSILSKHANTEFGKKYKFDKITSAEEFRTLVPIHEYEDLRPWIEEQDRMGRPVIMSTMPLMYATTSGTTGKPKYIPILKENLSAQKAIQNLSTYRLLKDHPNAFSGKLLGIVSPAVEGFMPSGIPFGSTSGHIYQGMPGLARKKYVVPYKTFEIENYDLKYLLIIRLAMGQRDISYIATANPSTLVRLANIMEKHWDILVEDIKNGGFHRAQELTVEQQNAIANRVKANHERANELSQLKRKKKGPISLSEIWPNLQVIGCWTGGSCSIFIKQLRHKLDPKVAIRDIGYLSSEFRGTFTLEKNTNAGVPSFQ